ncbi:MAG: four helix bundle protein [Prevotella sp.]|nr:four helix bundle protein [Prevotella sp.]
MKTKEENIIVAKSYVFAVRCVKLYKYLCDEKNDYTIGRQLMRSGTSIGANVKEATRGMSKADFTAKMSISLKEASESEFWIEILRDTNYITEEQADSMLEDCRELLKLLMSIVKTSKQ